QEEVDVLESLGFDLDPKRQTILKQMLTATRGRAAERVERSSIGGSPASKKRWWEIWR
ncbi:MAG: hypothetical protein HY678_05985, partial [Chloroflexi bacterium]|nr:hypothetical protein [Chloroflexota bacterium]